MPLFGPRRPAPITGEGGVGRNRGRLIGTIAGALGIPGASIVGRYYDRRRNERLENQLHGTPQRPVFDQAGLDLGALTGSGQYNQVGNIPGIGQPFNPNVGQNFGFQYATPNQPGLTDYGSGYNTNPNQQQMQSAWNQLFNPAQGTPTNQAPTSQAAGSNTWLEGQGARDYVDAGRWGTASNYLAAHARLNPGYRAR